MKPRQGRARRALALTSAVSGVLAGCLVGSGAAGAAPSYAYSLGPSIPVGKGPDSIAVDPGRHGVYVTSGNNSIAVIDETTNTVTARIRVGNEPGGIAVDLATHTVYVPNFADDTVSVIDEASNTVTDTIKVGARPRAIAVDPGTHSVFVVDQEDDTVLVIDDTSNTVTDTINVGNTPIAVAVDSTTRTVYVVNLSGNSASVIDEASRAVTATITGLDFPGVVAVDPGTRTAFVGSRDDEAVKAIDESSNTVTATIDVAGIPEGIAIDTANHLVYAAVDGPSNLLAVIDESSGAVLTKIHVGRGGMLGVAVDSMIHAAYFARPFKDHVTVVTQTQSPPQPSVTVISPDRGPTAGGQTVRITGSGFTSATRVMFGSSQAVAFTVDSDTQITAVTPAHASGTVRVRVYWGSTTGKTPSAPYTYD